MTPYDFTLWTLGFVETVKSRPTKAQWDMFVAKHAEVIGTMMKERLSAPLFLTPSPQYPLSAPEGQQWTITCTDNTQQPVDIPRKVI